MADPLRPRRSRHGRPADRGRAVHDRHRHLGDPAPGGQHLRPRHVPLPRPAFTPRAKNALTLTLRAATELGHERIDAEDMLLGLLAESEGLAIGILSALDVDAAALRQSVLDRLARQAT